MSKEEKFIEILQTTGLNYKEALLYFTLVKSGPKGIIVNDILHALPIKLNRTTTYSILRKLTRLGWVNEGDQLDKSKNATYFIATKPTHYFNNIITKKAKELEELEELKEIYLKSLQKIYHSGIEFSYDELDPFIKPYLKSLLEKNWRLKSYIVRKDLPMFEYEVYDCVLNSPNARLIKDNSFHVFIFDYNIEKDENALEFFIIGLKKKTIAIKSHFFDIKHIHLVNDIIKYNGKICPMFKMEIKINEFKKSEYFANIPGDLKKEKNRYSQGFFEIGKAVIIPINNKLFYLWAESDEILREMVEPIFKVENIPLKD